LPDSIMKRPKMGFPVPFGAWTRGRWNDVSREVLLDRRTRERGIIEPQAVHHLLADHAAGRTDGSERIWTLLNLELWYRTFIDRPKGSWRFYQDAALHLADPLPYAVGKYRSRAYRRRLEALLARDAFDLLICDFLVPAVNLPRRLPCPAVIFTHNVESEIWRRHAETEANRLKRFLYRTQYRRMLRFEARTLKRFDGVLVVSEADRESFDRIYPGSLREPAHVVPTGVETA